MSLTGKLRGGIRRADRALGQRIFSNPAGLRSNLAGQLAVLKARASGARFEGIDVGSPGFGEFVHLGRPYDPTTIDFLRKRFEEIISAGEHSFELSHEGEVYSYRIDSSQFDFREKLPEIEGLINEDLRETMREVYGSHFKPVRISMYRNLHAPPELAEDEEFYIYSNNWHVDAHTIDHVKLFVLLDDVEKNDGPFQVLSLEESMEMVEQGFRRGEMTNEEVEKATRKDEFTGGPGSAALANVSLQLHRAGVPARGRHRDIAQIVFAPAKDPLPDDWIEDREMYSNPGKSHNGLGRLIRY